MAAEEKPKIPLSKGWTGHARSAVLHIIGLAQYVTVYTRSWAANSPNERMRLKAENDRFQAEVALLKEEIRIKDARLLRWDPRKRPQYPPTERMAILELRAARSWSKQKTADAFHLTAATITTWMRRLDESGPDALVQLPELVNNFPDFVRYSVQLLKSLGPTMGKFKIARAPAPAVCTGPSPLFWRSFQFGPGPPHPGCSGRSCRLSRPPIKRPASASRCSCSSTISSGLFRRMDAFPPTSGKWAMVPLKCFTFRRQETPVGLPARSGTLRWNSPLPRRWKISLATQSRSFPGGSRHLPKGHRPHDRADPEGP